MSITLTGAVEANLAAALDADPRPDARVAQASWPGVTRHAAVSRLACMRKGERLTLDNLQGLAEGLGVEVDELTSTKTPAARAALGADRG